MFTFDVGLLWDAALAWLSQELDGLPLYVWFLIHVVIVVWSALLSTLWA